MDFGEELKKRKIQVTKVLRDRSNPMNQRRQKMLVLHCNISEEEGAVQIRQAASFQWGEKLLEQEKVVAASNWWEDG